MRPVRRRLFNFVTAVSLLLCGLIMILWARSYARNDSFYFYRPLDKGTLFMTGRGRFNVYRTSYVTPTIGRPVFAHWESRGGRSGAWGGFYHPALGTSASIQRRGPFDYAFVTPRTPPTAEQVREAEAVVRLWREEEGKPPPPPADRHALARRSRLRQRAASAADTLAPPDSGWGFGFPAWLAFAVTFALPAARIVPIYRTLRRRRLRDAGLCERCGYDLRATTGRCPECGTPAPAAAGATP